MHLRNIGSLKVVAKIEVSGHPSIWMFSLLVRLLVVTCEEELCESYGTEVIVFPTTNITGYL